MTRDEQDKLALEVADAMMILKHGLYPTEDGIDKDTATEFAAALIAAVDAERGKANGEAVAWRDLFWDLALVLKCLPSSYVDANDHVFRAAERAMIAAPEALLDALSKAFNFGQTYWQQADSDSYSQNAKSNITLQKFNDFKASFAAPQPPAECPTCRNPFTGQAAAAQTGTLAPCPRCAELEKQLAISIDIASTEAARAIELHAQLSRQQEVLKLCEGAIMRLIDYPPYNDVGADADVKRAEDALAAIKSLEEGKKS